MNENSDISNYLTNDISNDLKLHYGYFAVKNKNKPELTYKQNNVLNVNILIIILFIHN